MELCEFQIVDPSINQVFPWFTHPALELISKWDLSEKTILEYGAGYSTIWWGHKSNYVYTIESNAEWFNRIQALCPSNVGMSYRPCNEGDQNMIEFYTSVPTDLRPDIVVVDGILRYECILKALTLPRPLTLIVDNWQQDYVFICPAAEEALKDYEGRLFVQPDHKNHEGRPWTTAIWHLR